MSETPAREPSAWARALDKLDLWCQRIAEDAGCRPPTDYVNTLRSALDAARAEGQAERERLAGEVAALISVAGEALGTHPDMRSPGCVDALATAYTERGREVERLTRERDLSLAFMRAAFDQRDRATAAHDRERALLREAIQNVNAMATRNTPWETWAGDFTSRADQALAAGGEP